MREEVISVFEWWGGARSHTSVVFAEDFVFDAILEKQTRAEFIHAVSQRWMKWTEITLDELVIQDSESKGALMFRARDAATGLLYRTCWFLSFERGRILKIQAVQAIIPEEDSLSRIEPK